MVARLHPSRRGSNDFWCRHIINKLPGDLLSHKATLKALITSKPEYTRGAVPFANLIISTVKQHRLEQGSVKASESFVQEEPHSFPSSILARQFNANKPKCPSCTFFDCPKATDACAACDVYSPCLSNARILKLMKDAPKYLALVLHTRDEAAAKVCSALASAPTPAPAPTAPQLAAVQTTYADVTAGRRDFVAETLAALSITDK